VGGAASGWSTVPGPDGQPGSAVALPPPSAADQPALILYTSGTTSAPKGAYLSSRALLAQLRNMTTVAELDETSVVAAGTPVSHIGGLIAGLLLPAFLGARSVILPAWRPDEAVAVIERERVSVMMGATVFIQDLVPVIRRARARLTAPNRRRHPGAEVRRQPRHRTPGCPVTRPDAEHSWTVWFAGLLLFGGRTTFCRSALRPEQLQTEGRRQSL
jgi:hypothetical protein